jgi:hypothetical protein
MQPLLDLLQGMRVFTLQVTIRRHLTDFEVAYGWGEVTEEDLRMYLTLRTE